MLFSVWFFFLQVSCKVSQFIYLYLMGCNYFWMLCEGIYLHTLIVVAVFAEKQHLMWYYLLGWGMQFHLQYLQGNATSSSFAGEFKQLYLCFSELVALNNEHTPLCFVCSVLTGLEILM